MNMRRSTRAILIANLFAVLPTSMADLVVHAQTSSRGELVEKLGVYSS